MNSFGYVNLFPFLLKMVSPHSDKLGYLLERLKNDSVCVCGVCVCVCVCGVGVGVRVCVGGWVGEWVRGVWS